MGNTNPFAAIAGLGILFGAFVGITLTVVFGYLMPLSVFLTMRNTRKIALQLERLNDNLEGIDGGQGVLVRQRDIPDAPFRTSVGPTGVPRR